MHALINLNLEHISIICKINIMIEILPLDL